MANRPNDKELKKIIGGFVENQLNINIVEDSPFGEKLDSLNRLALIEFLSDKYAVDLSEILIDPKAWFSVETMTIFIISVIEKLDAYNA